MENIKIDLGCWNGVFAVPNAVVDEHIKLAKEKHLKTLLYILRHGGEAISLEALCGALSLDTSDAEECIDFWIGRGLLKRCESSLAPEDAHGENKAEDNSLNAGAALQTAPPRKPTRPIRPDGVYITKRIMEDKEFAYLADTAQSIIGKPLSTGDLGILLNLHDMDGLPVDVISMLLQFCVSREKFGMKYIESVGMAWARDGVDSLEKAEEKIKVFEKQCDAWGIASSIFGLKNPGSPTKNQMETANRWLNEWGYNREALRLAYEICVDTKGEYSLRYIDGIIKKWHKRGACTIKEIEELNAKEKPKQERKTSYDIKQIESIDEFK